MSSAIKPPGSHPADSAIEAPGEADKATAADTENFKTSLEKAAAVDAPQPQTELTGADFVQQLAQQIQAGQMEATAAVEALVARALEHQGAELLSGEQRKQLESTLRETLAADPGLQRLLSQLAGDA